MSRRRRGRDRDSPPTSARWPSSGSRSKVLEEEVLGLRRRLQDAPKRVRTLEEKLLETKGQLQQAISQNEKLTYTLREAREHIAALREEVDKLTQPPSAYGTFLGPQRRRHRRRVLRRPQDAGRPAPRAGLEEDELRRGQEVVLNESLNVVLARRQRACPARWSPSRSCSRTDSGHHRRPGRRGAGGRAGRDACGRRSSGPATSVLMDSRTGLLLEKLPRPEVEELVLEEVPDISYADVGGLDSQIEAITDAVELPFLLPGAVRRAQAAGARRASCCTGRPAAARRSSPRRSPTPWPRRWPR